jgi:hypothetical protein
VFDFCITRSELLALRKYFFLLCGELSLMREDLLMQRQDKCLQRFGIQLIEIARCGGIHSREHTALFLQHDENALENNFHTAICGA